MNTNCGCELHLGLVGYPLTHSISPALHEAAMKELTLQGEYRLYPVPSFPKGRRDLVQLLGRMQSGWLNGLNVTIPHKQNIIPFLDDLTPAVKTIRAVNTVFVRNGNLVGDNTDAPGFLLDLKRFLKRARMADDGRRLALILGAGGSARAVVYALLQEGWDIYVAARRLIQAQELAHDLASSQAVKPIPFDLRAIDFHPALIVNTTPLGMSPHDHLSPWPEGHPFPEGAAIYDLVYNPPTTKLIREARAQRNPASNGIGMLVEQALLAFARWTGKSAPREAMWQVVGTI